jgi:AraC-like DNA-binding protein
MYTFGTVTPDRRDRAASWSAAVSEIHCAMDFAYRDPERFRGKLERQASDSFQLVRWRGDEEQLTRTARQVVRDPRGTVELMLPVTGAAVVEQGGARVRATPGDMLLVAIDRPLRFWHGRDFSGIAFICSAVRVEQRGVNAASPRVLDASRGLGRIAADVLRGLRAERAALDCVAFDVAGERLVDLVCLPASDAAGTHRGAIAASIRRHVRHHAEDPSLDGSAIAGALGWSLRYVQQLLRDEGTTPRELIRSERLALARARLQSPAFASWPIDRIALSCGFGSASAFGRSFRAAYGVAPSTLRPR